MAIGTGKTKSLLVFALLAWPFFLNDLFLIYATQTQMNLGLFWAIDLIIYFIIPSTTLFVLFKSGTLNHLGAMLAKPPLMTGLVGAIFMAFGLDFLIIQKLGPLLYDYNCFRQCDGYAFPNQTWIVYYGTIVYAALSAGVLEELIFRGQAIFMLRQFTANKIVIVLAASLLFALIHWCLGSSNLLITFTIGLFPALWVVYTKRLWEVMAFHIIINLLAFT